MQLHTLVPSHGQAPWCVETPKPALCDALLPSDYMIVIWRAHVTNRWRCRRYVASTQGRSNALQALGPRKHVAEARILNR